MTTLRDKSDGDELVTETYRDLGVEQAPEHLNQAVLRMALDDGGRSSTSKLLLSAWIKPVTLAATIGLSLAIVLELTEVPSTAVRSDVVPVVESIREEEVVRSLDADDNKPKSVLPADEPVFEEAVANKLEILIPEAKGKVGVLAAPAPAAERPLVERSAARKRAADQASSTEPAASFAFSMQQEESSASESCDTTARQSAEDWLDCIERLRQSGAVDAADLEYEAYILEYPIESADLEPNK